MDLPPFVESIEPGLQDAAAGTAADSAAIEAVRIQDRRKSGFNGAALGFFCAFWLVSDSASRQSGRYGARVGGMGGSLMR